LDDSVKIDRYFKIAFLLTSIISLFFAVHLELTDQEAYYWTWSRELDLSYFDHPPLQAWTTAFLTYLLGQHSWVVRLPAVFGRLATLIFFYRYALNRYSRQVAVLSVLAILATPFFTIGSVVALPDSISIPFALATLFFIERRKVWSAAICFGFANLAKWTSIFFLPGYLYVLFCSEPKFKSRDKWISFIVPLLLQTPVFIWNYRHHGASYFFHLVERHEHHVLSAATYLEHIFRFIGLQLFAGGLSIIILGFVFVRMAKFNQISETVKKHVLWWSLPAFVIVGVSAVQGQMRFYWTGIAFFPLLAFLVHQVHSKVSVNRLARFLFGAVLLNLSLIAVAVLYPVGPIFEKVFHLRPDTRHSPRGDIAGWQGWVDNVLRPDGDINMHTAFIATNFRLAAQIAWATQLPVIQTSTVSPQKNEYRYWPTPNPPQFNEAIFVGDNRYDEIFLFNGLCREPLQWQKYNVDFKGQTVKIISWAKCKAPNALADNGPVTTE